MILDFAVHGARSASARVGVPREQPHPRRPRQDGLRLRLRAGATNCAGSTMRPRADVEALSSYHRRAGGAACDCGGAPVDPVVWNHKCRPC